VAGSYTGDISLISDITKPTTIVATTVPSTASLSMPVIWRDTALARDPIYFVTSAGFNAAEPGYYMYDRDMYKYLTNRDFGTVTSAFETYTGGSKYADFCSRSHTHCSATNTIVIDRLPVLTRDLLTVMPTTYVPNLNLLSNVLSVSSPTSLGNITAQIWFTAMFSHVPPSVVLTSFLASRSGGYVAVYGTNLGNPGSVAFSVNYTSGPSSIIKLIVSSGDFSVRLESTMVSSVCVGVSCLSIVYPPLAGAVVADTHSSVVTAAVQGPVSWFDTSNYPLYVIEVVGLTILCAIATGFLMFVAVRFARRRYWNSGVKQNFQ